MQAGYRGFRYHQNQVHAADGGDNGAANAGRTVNDGDVRLRRVLEQRQLYRGDQLAGIATAHTQLRGGEHPVPGIEPLLACLVCCQSHRPGRAGQGAYAAAFTGIVHDLEGIGFLRDGVKPAGLGTSAAAGTQGRINLRFLTAPKGCGLRRSIRLENQMQIGGVHIAVRCGPGVGECGKGRCGGGFSCTALAA